MELHAPKSGLRLADALIAATAVENALALLSGDLTHYRALSDLNLITFRP
jgi:predicted nucleic acid-binding protein